MVKGESKLPKGDLLEIPFTMFLHKQLVTIGPEYSVKPIEMAVTLSRQSGRSHWHAQGLDKGELAELPLPRGRVNTEMYGYEPVCFLLGAMIAVYRYGINPYDVKGWASLSYHSSHPPRAFAVFEQWLELEGVN